MKLKGRSSNAPFQLTFDGVAIDAIPGDTIAAALAAADVTTLRRTPGGERRGVWCGMGACWDCAVSVDGVRVRACLEKARAGAVVESAPPAAPAICPASAAMDRVCDVLVIGGGPAGLAAAAAAAEAGLETLLVDERAALGGPYFCPQENRHTQRRDGRQRRGEALCRRARKAGVELVAGALAWGAFAPDEVGVVAGPVTAVYRPRRLILAVGAYERPVPIPGWTLPGAMTVGAVQGLARAHRVAPGQRIVLAGSGPMLVQVAGELLEGGAVVAAVVEASPGARAPRLAARLAWTAPMRALAGLHGLRRLRRAGGPLLWGSRPVEWDGTALTVEGPGGTQRIAADLCALHEGFVPDTILARALGAEHVASKRWPGQLETVRDEAGRTSVPGLFVAGDCGGIGGPIAAEAQGRLAGLAAAAELGRRTPSSVPARRRLRRALAVQRALSSFYDAPPTDPARMADAVTVCRCESVSAGAVRRARAEAAMSLAAVKRATRAGMGACQGRMCLTTLHALCAVSGETGQLAPRAPVRPVPLARLMQPESVPDVLVPAPLPTRWVTTPPGPNPGDCDVLVIGGGIVGLSAARLLGRAGRDVVVADRGEPGMGASTANAGSLHVQLLPYEFTEGHPGPLADTPALAQQSIALWREVAAEAGEGLGLRTEGGLMLAKTAADLEQLRAKARFEQAQGVGTEIVGPNELAGLAPALARDYAGAAFCPTEGQGDPLRGTLALAGLARRAGARIAPGVEITGLARERAGWRVESSAGPFRAGQVLNAAGPLAARVAALARDALPIAGVVQQVIVTSPAPPMLRQLVAELGLHLSLKQGDGGYLLIGGGWPGRYDGDGAARLLRRSIQGNLWTAAQVMPALTGLDVVRAWTGLAVYLERGPVIGEGQDGLFHAVTSNGYTLGPVAGLLIAEAMLGRGSPPAAFAVRRSFS